MVKKISPLLPQPNNFYRLTPERLYCFFFHGQRCSDWSGFGLGHSITLLLLHLFSGYIITLVELKKSERESGKMKGKLNWSKLVPCFFLPSLSPVHA